MLDTFLTPMLDFLKSIFLSKEFLSGLGLTLGYYAISFVVNFVNDAMPGAANSLPGKALLFVCRTILGKLDAAMQGRKLAAKINPASPNAYQVPPKATVLKDSKTILHPDGTSTTYNF